MSKLINYYKIKYAEKLVLVAFSTIVFIFGINFIFVRISNSELPPFWGASLRYFLASTILWIIVFAKKLDLPNKKSVLIAVTYGLLAFAGNTGLLYWGLKSTSPATASIICASTPIITLLLSSITKIEKITTKGIVSGTLVCIGIYFISYSQMSENISTLPIAAILGASIFASLSTVVLKKNPQVSPIITNAIGMTCGAEALLLVSLISKESIILPTHLSTWGALIWLIISSTGAFLLLVWVISKWHVSKVSYTSVLSPLVTTLVSIIVLHQKFSLNFIMGGTVVLVGTLLAISNIKRYNLTLEKAFQYNYKNQNEH